MVKEEVAIRVRAVEGGEPYSETAKTFEVTSRSARATTEGLSKNVRTLRELRSAALGGAEVAKALGVSNVLVAGAMDAVPVGLAIASAIQATRKALSESKITANVARAAAEAVATDGASIVPAVVAAAAVVAIAVGYGLPVPDWSWMIPKRRIRAAVGRLPRFGHFPRLPLPQIPGPPLGGLNLKFDVVASDAADAVRQVHGILGGLARRAGA